MPKLIPLTLRNNPVVRLLLSVALFAVTYSANAEQVQQPTIAIIIDDMGNHYQNGTRLINLPFPLTLSFLPERRFTPKLSSMAKAHNKEIMLHTPMENSLGIGLGKGGLNESMSELEIKQTLIASFASVPYMIGINNHMGSKLTTKPRVMKWVMETIQQYPYFFLDSRTTAKSVAAQTAQEFNIPNLSRDIFLDHQPTRAFIQKQFLKLIELAKEKGTAIAIAHPHKVTVDYLTRALPKLDEKGISIATASAIWQIQNPKQSMKKTLANRANQKAAPQQVHSAKIIAKRPMSNRKNLSHHYSDSHIAFSQKTANKKTADKRHKL
jgi:polysaccharide deacetylase 2 family uncharacterized protein YibQ